VRRWQDHACRQEIPGKGRMVCEALDGGAVGGLRWTMTAMVRGAAMA